MAKHSIGGGMAILVGVLGLCLILSAQEGRGTGRIHGTVMDTSGKPLLGVTITAVHSPSGTSFKGQSDKNGKWAIVGLGTGNFRITAEMEGYNPEVFDMRVSQFSRNNPPVAFTLQKIQTQEMGMIGLDDSGAAALFEEGNRLYSAEKYSEAAAKFQEFLMLHPELTQVYLNLGNCFRTLEDFEQAVASSTRVLDSVREAEGTYEGSELAARALAAIGETHMMQGDLDQASSCLQEAMAVFPQDETLAFNIGEIFFQQGDAAKGAEYFLRAIEIKPDWPPPHRQRGYALLNQADYKGALQSFQKFLELAPEDSQAATIRALIPQLESLIKK